MQRINAWAQFTIWVTFIISVFGNLIQRISSGAVELSDNVVGMYPFIWPSRPKDAPVYRPYFTWRDILDKFLGLPFIFVSDQWEMPLKEQRMHLTAALERNGHRIRAQQDRLNELLDQLEQANLANEQLQLDCEQLRLDCEHLKTDDIKQEILISTLRFTNKDRKASLQRAEQRIAALDLQKAALQRQNAGLATKIMGQQRQMFTIRLETKKLEREKLGQQDLMEEIASIKTLVANSLYATNPLGKSTRKTSYEIVPARKDMPQVPKATHPLSTPSDASSVLPCQHSLGESLDPGSGPSSQLSLEAKILNVRTRSDSVDEAAQTERRVRRRIIKIVDAGLSRCRAQGWFRDEFDLEQYDSEVDCKDDGTTGIQTVMEMVYKGGV